ncbi:MAG: hypothetical protein R3Y13_06030 [bacterium]
MFPDKTKIRISSFVTYIIQNDCGLYDFINNKSEPNKNDFLNKLIPNLLEIRKKRRRKIYQQLSLTNDDNDVEQLYNSVNMIIDEVYFNDEELEIYDDHIWIRPQNETKARFDEIEESETKITCLDRSNYIRGLLNEYSRFPQYKRGEILFAKELQFFKEASFSKNIVRFKYRDVVYRVYIHQYMYGFLYDQSNKIIAYDVDNNVIRSFDIAYIKSTYLLQKKYKPSQNLIDKIDEYISDYNFDDDNQVLLEGE